MHDSSLPREYLIQPSGTVFDTGILPNGEQVILGVHCPHIVIVFFDAEGNLQRVAVEDTPFTPDELLGPLGGAWIEAWLNSHHVTRHAIRVRRFLLPELHIGVSDLPEWLRDYLADPNSYSEDQRRHIPELLAEWTRLAQYSFQWVEEYDMSAEGEIVGS